MKYTKQIAKHLREVFFGGNWTAVNIQDTISDLTLKTATKKIDNLNSIVAITYHIDYYVLALLSVLDGGELNAHDKFSFDAPSINTENDWNELRDTTLANARKLIYLIEQLSDEKLNDIFVEEKYGNYYRNLHGVVDHTHYHLGQVVLLKKIILTRIS